VQSPGLRAVRGPWEASGPAVALAAFWCPGTWPRLRRGRLGPGRMPPGRSPQDGPRCPTWTPRWRLGIAWLCHARCVLSLQERRLAGACTPTLAGSLARWPMQAWTGSWERESGTTLNRARFSMHVLLSVLSVDGPGNAVACGAAGHECTRSGSHACTSCNHAHCHSGNERARTRANLRTSVLTSSAAWANACRVAEQKARSLRPRSRTAVSSTCMHSAKVARSSNSLREMQIRRDRDGSPAGATV
jgi:hypothetical protein